MASHAQKYFIRLNSTIKYKRRSRIHDITSVNGSDVSSPQGPITGQGNQSSGQSANHASQPGLPSVYGATIGQPIVGPMVSIVGTPVMLPPGHALNVVLVAYSMPQPTMHR